MSHEEEAIAKAQAESLKSKGADGLNEHHKKNIAGQNERIVVFILALAFIGLIGVWTLAKSDLVLYGSLVVVILLVIFWGIIRIKRIQHINQQRAEQAKSWQSKQRD